MKKGNGLCDESSVQNSRGGQGWGVYISLTQFCFFATNHIHMFSRGFCTKQAFSGAAD